VGYIRPFQKKYRGWKIDRCGVWSAGVRTIIGPDDHFLEFNSRLFGAHDGNFVIHDAALRSWLQQDAVRRTMNNLPPDQLNHDGYFTIDSLLMSVWQTKTIATAVAQFIVDTMCRDHPDLWARTTDV
jgi:hypothetical protein